jgi:MFS family permease
MNRFDRDFNDTDPITHRPFSGGHPDGVWIIVILLGIPLFAAMAGALITAIMLVFTRSMAGLGSFLGAIAAVVGLSIVFVPPIVLLFRRSRHAITRISVLFSFFASTLVAGFVAPEDIPIRSQIFLAGVIGCVLFGSFIFYLFRLKRQELLR